ncbi:hypothetical protein R1flu_028508 [Riccia fluitans]|uniref:Uncharacterized protein n=1 Tax=Riccia fluitans TaxID=41844 RepID=A0ABD1XLV9_9MARC
MAEFRNSAARATVQRWHASAVVNSSEELLDAFTLANWMQVRSAQRGNRRSLDDRLVEEGTEAEKRGSEVA